MLHALDRFVIHFFSASGLLLFTFFGLLFLKRKWLHSYIPDKLVQQLVYAGAIILFFAFGREAIDVHNGQPFYKVFTDNISWICGVGCGIWGIMRLYNIPRS